MKPAIVFGSVLLVFSTVLCAQSPLVGKYSGAFTAPDNRQRDKQWGVTIEITRAENGKLEGTIQTSGTKCAVVQPAEGTYDGNNIKMAGIEGRGVPGCGAPRFDGIAEGNKLVGKMPFGGTPRDLTVSK